MTECLYGSQKKESSPPSFTIDTGAICFLLGVDSFICPLLDKIPSVVGSSWKEIIRFVAKEGLGIVIDQITGQIETESFCASPSPSLPSDITYGDVFNFIASYVPPLSIVASGNGLLLKVTQFYLFEKWNNLCECKIKKPLPENGSSSQIVPPFVGSCPASQALKTQMDNEINAVNTRNGQNSQPRFAFRYTNDETGNGFDLSESQFNTFESDANDSSKNELISKNYAGQSGEPATVSKNIGGIAVTIKGGVIFNRGDAYVVRSISSGDFGYFRLTFKEYIKQTITWDESSICTTPPPPPKLPEPPLNCIPVPPPRFCELFPDDPLCANVPNKNCNEKEITVRNYDCEIGEFSDKIVLWRID